MSDDMSDDITIPKDMVNIFWATTTSETLLSRLIAAQHFNNLKLQSQFSRILNCNINLLL